MDALMIVLVVTLLGQAGGRASGLAVRLAERTGRAVPVLAGMMLAQGILAAIAVAIGIELAPQVTPETRTLLLGIALALVGIGLAGRLPGAAPPDAWLRLGGFGTAAIGGGAILLGDSGLVLVAAAAARSPLPWAAWPGAVLGLLAAIWPAILLGEREWRRLPWRAIRMGLGTTLLLSAIVIVLSTKGLI